LALYGIAHLLKPEATVRWTGEARSGWRAEVISDQCADVDGLVEVLADTIRSDSLSDVKSLAKDVNELTAETWSKGISRQDAVARLVIGLSAEAPLRAGARTSLTPLCVYSFGSRGTLFGNVAKQDSTIKSVELRAVLMGAWTPKRDCNTLGLDPGARRQDGATMGPDPSADGVRGVPGLLPLMIRGLAAVAPMPGEGRVRGGAFVRTDSGVEFRWPTFNVPVSAAALPLVVARDWTARSGAQRIAAGVEAVFAARILRGHGRLSGRLAIGRRVA
jgi:hypothetical protein